MRKKIWVVIPYYRDSAALSRCVNKLNQSTVKDLEIFVRDNTNDNILYTAAVNEGNSIFTKFGASLIPGAIHFPCLHQSDEFVHLLLNVNALRQLQAL